MICRGAYGLRRCPQHGQSTRHGLLRHLGGAPSIKGKLLHGQPATLQLRSLQYAQPDVVADPAIDPQALKTLQTYQALLKIVSLTAGTPAQDKFLRARPEATSVPFIAWVADQEAALPSGPAKQHLATICERLVVARETLDDEGMEDLYASTMNRLTARPGDRAVLPAGVSRQDSSTADAGAVGADADGSSANSSALALLRQQEQTALLADPARYSTRLAEVITGVPVVTSGFSPLMDLLVQAVPPAALTPEGVRQGHARAQELGQDLQQRRRRSVSSIIGRTQLTPQEADRLLAGSAAARILDMLMTLPNATERISLLPDCFTPPPEATTSDPSPDSQPERDASPNTRNSGSDASPTPSSSRRSSASPSSNSRGSSSSPSSPPLPQTHSEPQRSSEPFTSVDTLRDSDSGAFDGDAGRSTPADEAQAGPSGQSTGGGDDVDVLWCTPAQLLNEIDSRLAAISGSSGGSFGGGPATGAAGGRQRLTGGSKPAAGLLGSGTGQLVGEALVQELQALRKAVAELWLRRL